MSEKEQQEYKKETRKRPLYFNKPSKDFRDWLEKRNERKQMSDEEKAEEVIRKQSDQELRDRNMQDIENKERTEEAIRKLFAKRLDKEIQDSIDQEDPVDKMISNKELMDSILNFNNVNYDFYDEYEEDLNELIDKITELGGEKSLDNVIDNVINSKEENMHKTVKQALDEELEKLLEIQDIEEGINEVINEENIKKPRMSLANYLNVDVDKAEERSKQDKNEKRMANRKWQVEKSNQEINDLHVFVKKLKINNN